MQYIAGETANGQRLCLINMMIIWNATTGINIKIYILHLHSNTWRMLEPILLLDKVWWYPDQSHRRLLHQTRPVLGSSTVQFFHSSSWHFLHFEGFDSAKTLCILHTLYLHYYVLHVILVTLLCFTCDIGYMSVFLKDDMIISYTMMLCMTWWHYYCRLYTEYYRKHPTSLNTDCYIGPSCKPCLQATACNNFRNI